MAWIAAGFGDLAAPLIALAVAACLLRLLGARLVANGRPARGALLLADALLRLGLGIGEYALIRRSLWLLAILLAVLRR